ncbi:MAG: tyrosine-type recombinase/integrase [Parvibaculum sp.]
MADELIPERAPAFQLPAPADGLERLVGKAKAYAKGAKAGNTQTAYGNDWRDYAAWCLRHGVPALPPSAQAIGLYITDLAGQGRAVSTIERRLSGICWHFRQNKLPIDRSDPHIREVLAGIRNKHSRVPTQKAAVAATDIIAMTGTLDTGLVGIRDRAILLVGFAGGLRRSEIVGLDHGAGETEEGLGWPEFLPGGVVLRIRGKGNRWREVEIGRGSSARTCPVACLEEWMAIARIVHGPVFRRIAAKRVQTERLSDRYVARLVQRTAIAAGVRGDLAEGARREAFAGHSLRAGLASSAEVDERYVQRQLGHATVTMTRRYQRERDRFRVNLTKVAGL